MIIDDAHESEVDEENYFVSMTDMMVGLVFIFIIMLMYFAVQFQDVTAKLTGADLERAKILRDLERTLKAKGVPVTIEEQNGVLRLPDAILFDSGRAELKPEGKVAVGHLADALRDVIPCYTDSQSADASRPVRCPKTPYRIESVYVEGHTDVDRYSGGGMLRDNWDLSVVRATNTYRELTIRQPGLSQRCSRRQGRCEAVLSVSGYGAERPVDTGDSPAAKRSNRRIDLRLLMVTPDASATSEVDKVSERLKTP
ncbi:OmpA family protein [Caulobacter sp. SLTY]|uniref:OmpA/MotB family protein n=1 Tax=Caulobacter sp. SLTY TaxID=2683262 RepID=UPI001412B5F9|nr:OmpA family protein [Caulobacter sp. SLTY]NBB16286.1 OmpA family protein [Caulobacter sp. SLTY]